MKQQPSGHSVDDALASAEALLIPDEDRERIKALLRLERDTQATPEEAAEFLFPTLEERFQNPPAYFTPIEGVSFVAVKEALGSHPNLLLAAAKLEANSGEVNVFHEDQDYYYLGDASQEAPTRGWGVRYGQAVREVQEMGAEMMDREMYEILQQRGHFDNNRHCWLRTQADQNGNVAWANFGTRSKKITSAGVRSHVEIRRQINNIEFFNHWRGFVRIPKKK